MTDAPASPHALSVEGAASALETDLKNGLSGRTAAERLNTYGRNELPKEKKRSVVLLFLKQFHNVLTYILLAAGAVSVIGGERVDAYAIVLAVLIKAVIGFVQERRAEAAVEKLQGMVIREALVLRDGKTRRIPAAEIVPGDVLLLSEGDRVPADARIVEARELSCKEAALTGESGSVRKSLDAVPAGTLVPDRKNMVWMGTNVLTGQGKAIVAETGGRTEFGKIAMSLVSIKHERTPLEARMDRLGRRIGMYAIGFSVVVLAIGAARGFPLIEMFFFIVALLVSVIPEGLPVVLVIVLTIGVQRMAKRNAIIRHLPSVETLGVADVICTDKTGTLTENKMTVREVAVSGHRVEVTGEGWDPRGELRLHGRSLLPADLPELDLLIRAATLCNRSDIEWRDDQPGIVGDPTEGALVVLGAKAGYAKPDLQKEYVVVDELPFNSERKFRAMLVEHVDVREKRSKLLIVVGAYGMIRDRSAEVAKDGKNNDLDPDAKTSLDAANSEMASRAFRVLGVAYKKMPLGLDAVSEDDVRDLTFLGIVGMIDPPREGVARAIARCRGAGVRVIMVTGDQKATAIAIGREIGLVDGEREVAVYTEKDVAAMSEEAFGEAVRTASIFARVAPQTKFRIVEALKAQGHVVAMTGDGVNDAPALKSASIGISMGIAGTDVTKEVADMVLADDNFVSIVNAIEEGRIVFRNVKQTTAYLFMTNFGEVAAVMSCLMLGLPLPLLPAQILWMNLVTDGFPDMALATEPAHGDMLAEPPRKKNAPIIPRNTIILAALSAALMSAGTVSLFAWALRDGDLAYARTVAFTAMSVFQMWNIFNMRSATESLFSLPPANVYIIGAVALSLSLQLAVLYLPPLSAVFRVVPLGATELLTIALVTSSIFVAVELYKLLIRRGFIPRAWV